MAKLAPLRLTRMFVYFTILGLLGWFSFAVGRLAVVRAQAQQTVTIRPFVSERWLVAYNTQNPNGEVQRKELFERASNGAMCIKVLEVPAGPGEAPTRKLSLPDGRMVFINDEAQIRSTLYSTTMELARMKAHLARAATMQDCGEKGETREGDGVIVSRNTQAWQRDVTDGHPSSRMISYRSPELGCEDLKRVFAHLNPDGTSKVKWEIMTQSLSESEPLATDMDPGDSYREVLPSEFDRITKRAAALIDEALKSGWCDSHDCTAIRQQVKKNDSMDQHYLESQKHSLENQKNRLKQ